MVVCNLIGQCIFDVDDPIRVPRRGVWYPRVDHEVELISTVELDLGACLGEVDHGLAPGS